MNRIRSVARIILIVFTGFLALTAVPGGVALMANFYAPPVEQLAGTPFKSFFIPGLALTVIVGGAALVSLIALLRRSRFATLFATVTGVIIVFFEFIEVLTIGSPPGPAMFMQVFYLVLGTLIEVAGLGTWFLELQAAPQAA